MVKYELIYAVHPTYVMKLITLMEPRVR
jgi:hypothetical protein